MTSQQRSPALYVLLRHVAHAVAEVTRQGRSLNDVLLAVPDERRPGVQALSFQVLRGWGRARAILNRLVPRPPPVAVATLLESALALLEAEPPPYSAHTLVDQAVRALDLPATAHTRGLANAVLRRWLRDAARLRPGILQDPVARWNHPDWWIKQLQQAWPADWGRLLEINNQHAPLVLRVNRRRSSREALLRTFEQAGLQARPVGDSGIWLPDPVPVSRIPGFEQGLCSVQDAGAQLAAPLLAPRDGERILDACAAPGGKTAHLLELADAQVTAVDIDAARLSRVTDTLRRLGLSARLEACDAIAFAKSQKPASFDAILADVPCTASGVVRRHPDIRWLRRAEDVRRTAVLQARILDALWPLLRPGGRLLYMTCSIFPQEGADVLAAFLARHTDAGVQVSPGLLLPQATTSKDPGRDGFFLALLQRSAA
jgi:16S rRNA (cytosine967-C5)-methyltransferase